MASNHEQGLIKIYKAMSSDEIERRLANADLSQMARGVAENELHQRRVRAAGAISGSTDPNAEENQLTQPKPPSYNPVTVAFLIVLALLLAGGVWLARPDLFLQIAAVGVVAFILFLGKIYPVFGMFLGVLLVGAAIAIPIVGFMFPAKDTAENLLRFFFGAIAVAILLVAGASLIHGARQSRRRPG